MFLKIYWTKRVFRLWPAAFFVATLTYLVFLIALKKDVSHSYFFSIFSLQNIHIFNCLVSHSPCEVDALWHYWSLSAEEQFYLLAPLILVFINKAYIRLLAVVACLFLVLTLAFFDRPFGTLGWAVAYDGMLLGMIISCTNIDKLKVKNLFFINAGKIFIALFLVFLTFGVGNDFRITHLENLGYKGISFFSISSFFVVMLTLLIFEKKSPVNLLDDFVSYIGSRTYSIYLCHLPIFAIFGELNLRFTKSINSLDCLILLIALIITFIFSEIVYKCIEHPLRNLGRKLTAKD